MWWKIKKWLWLHYFRDVRLEPECDSVMYGRAKRADEKRQRDFRAAKAAYSRVVTVHPFLFNPNVPRGGVN